ncbi:MAG: LemA family protein [Fimbriimonadaceae bacterium]|nr:LemA family protein [Fimbriimonadaceae bacterium]
MEELLHAIVLFVGPNLYWIGPLISLFAVFGAYRQGQRRRQIQGLPTSKVKGVFIGFVELYGQLRCDAPRTSYLAEIECAYYRYAVYEHWEKTETYRDSDGRTKTRKSSGWSEVDSRTAMVRFDLEDETGRIRVNPQGAEIEAPEIFSQTVGMGHPLYYGKGPMHSIPHSTHRRRFVEYALRPGFLVFVLGQSRERDDRVEPEIAFHPDSPRFLISHRTEAQIVTGHRWQEAGFAFLALLLAIGLPAWQIYSPELADPFPIEWLLAYALGMAGVFMLSGSIGVYNSLVEIYQRVRQGESLIDVQLKRRFDLITNLVQTVRHMQRHEANLLERLTELRGSITDHDGQPVARQLIALAESYPDLKSNRAFLGLQKELIDTEDRIALARRYYVECRSNFMTMCEKWPNLYIARLGRFRSPEPLDFDPGEFERPNVVFSQVE